MSLRAIQKIRKYATLVQSNFNKNYAKLVYYMILPETLCTSKYTSKQPLSAARTIAEVTEQEIIHCRNEILGHWRKI